jgi:SAM-dependent methyltransferase
MSSLISKAFSSLTKINLLIEPTICHYYTVIRALYYTKIKRSLSILESQDAVKTNAMHNLRSLYRANNRMQLLLYPLAIIETLNRDSKILIIGPRNENDLYRLAGLGFSSKNIVGLDLLSYSPRIKLGDMHDIPFPADHFDAVVCGWTLSYSTNPQRAINEILRVTRPNGIVAIGVEYATLSEQDEIKLTGGYAIQEPHKAGERINSTAAIRHLCQQQLGHVYFEHDAPNRVGHTKEGLVNNVSNVALIFSKRVDGH